MQFGEKIRGLRQNAGLTQPELAEHLKIEQSWLSKIETGKVVPGSEFIQATLNYFEMTLDELIQDVDSSHLQAQLGAVPEIAGLLYRRRAAVRQQRKWWFIAAILLCTVGGVLLMLASQSILFPPNQYLYRSEGLIYFGEPLNLYSNPEMVFDMLDLGRIPSDSEDEGTTEPNGNATQAGTTDPGRSKQAEFSQYVLTRQNVETFVSNFDRGEYWINDRFVPLGARNIYGNAPQAAQRVFYRSTLESRNPYNSTLYVLGYLFFFLGLGGFAVEFKLSKVDS